MSKKEAINKVKDVDLIGLYKKEKDHKIKTKLFALSKLQENGNISKVSKEFHVEWNTLNSWLKKFTELGVGGLKDKPRSGRKPKFPSERAEELKAAIEKAQLAKEGGRIIGKDIQEILLKQFESAYDLDSIYRLLKRIGMVCITGRSIHPKANKEAQEAFKKTFLKK